METRGEAPEDERMCPLRGAAAIISVAVLRAAAVPTPAAASTAGAGTDLQSQSCGCPRSCPSAGCCLARPSWRREMGVQDERGRGDRGLKVVEEEEVDL